MKAFFNKSLYVLILLVLVFSSTGRLMPAAAAASSAYVRLNQVGFSTGEPKRAYLLASGAETGATFAIKNSSGAAVYSGSLGAKLIAWSSTYSYVYALDFDAFNTPGSYTIAVTGPIAAVSPTFKIDTAASLFSFILSNAVFFYQAQRDGPNVVSSVMNRKPSHLNDQTAVVYNPPVYSARDVLKSNLVAVAGAAPRDVSGGWFDAGDFIKGVQTVSYAEALLLAAARDYPDLVGANTSADIFAEAKFGNDWLMKMWDDSTQTLYYQVGLGNGNSSITGDHDIWRLPEVDDTYGGTDAHYKYIRNRPALRAGAPGSLISPNLAGRMAADFALCYLVYKASDPTYSNQCLLSAEHIFDLANTAPTGNLLTYSPYDYYPEVEWRDDLELAASELYFAVASSGLPAGLPHTDPKFYLGKAATWANAYITGPNDAADSLNLYDVTGWAHYELYKAISQAGNPGGLAVTQAALLADMKKQLDLAVAQAAKDPFGFGRPYNVFDGTSHAQGLIIMASEYDELTGTTTYTSFARNQVGVILGSNAWGTSFIVGAGSTFPKCMQHQVANLAGSLDGTTPIVKGAPVNGTNSTSVFKGLGLVSGMRACPPAGGDVFASFNGMSARYYDNVVSWPTVEPAIDFAGTTPLAFCRWIKGLH